MEENNNIPEVKTTHRKRNVIIALVAVLVVALAAVLLVLLHARDKGTDDTKLEEREDLSELHVFPPIEFADSLYYKKTIVSYEDESPRDVYYYEKDSLGQPTDVRVHETHFYEGEKKYIDGNISENQRDGLWYAYHKNGNVQTMAHYENGKENGRYTVYYPNGNVYYTGYYKNGERVGVWRFYDQNEKLVRSENFDLRK